MNNQGNPLSGKGLLEPDYLETSISKTKVEYLEKIHIEEEHAEIMRQNTEELASEAFKQLNEKGVHFSVESEILEDEAPEGMVTVVFDAEFTSEIRDMREVAASMLIPELFLQILRSDEGDPEKMINALLEMHKLDGSSQKILEHGREGRFFRAALHAAVSKVKSMIPYTVIRTR